MNQGARLSPYACDPCRIKKYKCTKEQPACQSCRQHNRICYYRAPILRSPLTRQHVTEVETRLQNLEALFARLLPDVNIDDELSSSNPRSPLQSGIVAEPGTALSQDESSPSPALAKKAKTVERAPSEPAFEALPQQADGFDWKEEAADIGDLPDGMASLSIEPSGIGYLGPSSGVVFLRSLMLWNRNRNPVTLTSPETTPSPQDTTNRPSSISQFPSSTVSHQLASALIDAYFSNYHTTYPFLHEATFRAQYSELVKRPEKHSWRLLLNSVLALGAWTIGDEFSNLDDVFYREASRFSHDHSIFESGSLTLVQALVLLSNYVQKRNKPNTGWNYLGLAVRMALSLGFHREFPEWKISLLQREMRRRVWWGLFVFDSGASMTFGRAILLPEKDMIDANHVLNVHDQLLTPLTTTVPVEEDEPTLYSGLIAQSKFHLTSNHISNRLLSTPVITASEVLSLNAIAELWSITLPWYLQFEGTPSVSSEWFLFARSRLWWRFWNLQIILTRPILLRWATRCIESQDLSEDDEKEKDCRSTCVKSAHMTINSVDDYVRNNQLSRIASWYTLYFIFHAALVPAVCICADSSSPDALSWDADIDMTRSLLLFAFPNNTLANRCLEFLNRLIPAAENDATGTQTIPRNADTVIEDSISWLGDPNDPLNSIGWPEFGLGA